MLTVFKLGNYFLRNDEPYYVTFGLVYYRLDKLIDNHLQHMVLVELRHVMGKPLIDCSIEDQHPNKVQ